MCNVKMVSHPKNTTVHKHLDARSYKGCIVAGSNPVLTTKRFITVFFSCRAYTNVRQVFLNKGMVLAKDISYIDYIKRDKMEDHQQKIIELQEEMIQLLTNGIQARDKFIEFLEKRLNQAEKFITIQHEQQQK